ncbi:DUF4375 domain-containing protein [Spirosoma sp. HMF4905]|uniref:DUF4375 domain-containing protein n=1 Tax=Spirosoma arboris TaxID=2682092 RepID=A0A7K1S567_9BACT|nr:DUF4375 domain-containing protein [Spirosoma arboris]MVM28885.1 DUF4375 domain-containing protein [Spirosoma arboris]
MEPGKWMSFGMLFIFLSAGCTKENKDQSNLTSNFYQQKPQATIEQLVAEVDNGGFNQYFFNSSGVDCFETLKALKKRGKTQTAQILQRAIHLINPENLPENQLVEKLRNRAVNELDDEQVNRELSKLDSLFYKEPDGPLIP